MGKITDRPGVGWFDRPLARAFLDNPRWVWHAAERLGAEFSPPPQYARTSRAAWPGAALVRP